MSITNFRFIRRGASFVALVFPVLLQGCVVGPNYDRPQPALPTSFDTGPALLPTTIHLTPPTTQAATTQPTSPTTRPTAAVVNAATRAATRPVDLARWWESFDDPELDSLVVRAAGANFDIGIAALRLQEARAAYAVASGSALPLFDITAAAARGSGTNSTKGRIGAPLNAATNTQGLVEITHVVGFDAAWELDLFGGIRRAIEAARADVQVAEQERKQILVSVAAEVCRSYSELRTAQLRFRIAQDNVAAQRRTVDLVRFRLQQGLGNDFDVVLAERQLSASLARIAPLQSAVRELQRRIAMLIGVSPQDLYAELDEPGRMPGLGAEVDIGVPLALVRRRPDIDRAERLVAASSARIGVATAQLFPQVALTAGLGFQGQGLGVAPVSNQLLWSIGPAVRWPLLDFGRLDAQVQVQNFRTRALLLAYKRTVTSAIEEVENAVDGYAAQRNRLEHLTVAVESSEQAVNMATQRFDLGIADFLNVLDAQRQLNDLQDQLAVTQQAATTQLVGLYKALGGGWEAFGAVPPPRGPRPAVLAAAAAFLQASH